MQNNSLLMIKVSHLLLFLALPIKIEIWAASWQNQQNDCAPNKDSDQLGHPPSLIRVFAVRMKKVLRWADSHFVGFVMRLLIYKVSQKHKRAACG